MAVPALQGLAAEELEALIAALRDDLAASVRAATVGDWLRFLLKGIVVRGVHP